MKGYAGKLLFIDLGSGIIREEIPDDSLYRDYVGGYGLGARILYDRMQPGIDPLGPDNILGFLNGPLTGTPTPTGARYVAVAKSPLTGGWGDANSGGRFGPALKFAGYDGVFFTGISERPVYLFIDHGKAEIVDASEVWGKDCYETEEILREKHGKGTELVCIGPFGEKVSLISCIITEKGAAAGRSGLGAVMGSKRLKAVVALGDESNIELADKERVNAARKKHVEMLQAPGPGGGSFLDMYHNFGSTFSTAFSVHNGDSPVKNWGGIGIKELPDVSTLSGEASTARVDKRYGCWHCPIACQAALKEGTGEYNYPAGTRRPEYETQASFGPLCCNNNTESIEMVNYICNAYGIDTISGGCVVAFAMECYENGILTSEDTEGMELTWGNHKAIVDLTWRIARREGLGDILADGVKVAAEKIGKGAEKYAVHIGGQEPGMHDPKLGGVWGETATARFQLDATPGRHTQFFGLAGFSNHLINAIGCCAFGFMGPQTSLLPEYMAGTTGLERSMDELLKCGERIGVIRHLFTLREGINPLELDVHPRIVGDPPQEEGPLANVTLDYKRQNYWALGTLNWDMNSTRPKKEKLLELGMEKEANDLWPMPNFRR
ncbi:MAG: aldehyde ferredoxin oxidoreductase family protein [Dehalococcoidales bacterium]|nr:aldehyde ferredoxin oxidoreductase family protein [Dehalococcoidales bacterium]